MLPRELFEQNLELIERTVQRACVRAGIFGADAEDLASTVKIALIEDDFAILRNWEQRSSLATYLAVIARRLVADAQIRTFGRWRPSSEAIRLGETAVMIESLVLRRGRSLDEVLSIVSSIDPSLTRERVEAIVRQLPPRAPRPRLVELDETHAELLRSEERADSRTAVAEATQMADRAVTVVRKTLEQFTDEDRTIISFRFSSGMSIADISRMMRLPQRPLYRRIESLLGRLRAALTGAGIDATSLFDAIESSTGELDFGMPVRKNDSSRQTLSMEDL